MSVIVTTTAVFRWAILLNPTIAGTALTWADVANSSVQATTTSTNATTVSGGTVLFSGYGNQSTTGDINLTIPVSVFLGSTIAGVPDEIYLAIQNVSAGAETYFASLSCIEG